MKKSKSFFTIEHKPTVLGKDITTPGAMVFAGLLILTGILAPIGMIMFLMGGHHKAHKVTASKKKKKR